MVSLGIQLNCLFSLPEMIAFSFPRLIYFNFLQMKADVFSQRQQFPYFRKSLLKLGQSCERHLNFYKRKEDQVNLIVDFIILSLAKQQQINDHIFCSGLLIFYKVSERVHSCAEDYTLFNLITKKTLSTIGFVFQTLKSCHWWIFPASHFYKMITGSGVLCMFSCHVRHIEASYLKLASGLGSTRLW